MEWIENKTARYKKERTVVDNPPKEIIFNGHVAKVGNEGNERKRREKRQLEHEPKNKKVKFV